MADNDSNQPPPQAAAKVLGREPPVRRKRFYKGVTIAADSLGFGLHLDGRRLKTPRKLPLALPARALAEAMAAEWAAQGADINPASMQLTTLVFTAIDAVAGHQTEVAAEIGRYASSDLLCYRADGPAELVARQAAGWDPILAWAEKELEVVFRRTSGLMPVKQDTRIADTIQTRLATTTALDLAATSLLTTLTGSAVLALAVRAQRLDIGAAWQLAHIDETWQIEKWGTDAEAQSRQALRLLSARAAATVFALLQS
jgi:chaperone required for assembly of F1-ATPase